MGKGELIRMLDQQRKMNNEIRDKMHEIISEYKKENEKKDELIKTLRLNIPKNRNKAMANVIPLMCRLTGMGLSEVMELKLTDVDKIRNLIIEGKK